MKRAMKAGGLGWMGVAFCVAVLLCGSGRQAAAQTAGAPTAGGTLKTAGPAPLARLTEKSAETRGPGAPLVEGLKVHGHWVIDIRNADGTLAQHHEFENALSATGGAFVVGMLSGQYSAGGAMVTLSASSGNGPCNGPAYQFCGIATSLSAQPAVTYCGLYLCSGTLTVTPSYGTNLNGPYSLVYAGSITANQAGTIGSVYTVLASCAAAGTAPAATPTGPTTVLPGTCATTGNNTPYVGPFTTTNITPISVASGQLIQVQVTISFS